MYASWEIYRSAALYMLLGFFIAGVLRVLIPTEKIGALLGCGRFRPVLLAALIGVPLPLCSCGVIPAAAGLRKQGAGKGATLSFLISTPESGVDSISISYALLDPLMTIARPVAGFLTAMVAGVAESFFGRNTPTQTPLMSDGCNCSGNVCQTGLSLEKPTDLATSVHPFRRAFTRLGFGIRYAFDDLLGDVGKWFILGTLIAGGITLLIPDTLFAVVSENRLLAMLIAMAAGIPMYVCATASTPIAAALILKGLNPGAALVFLMLGPATNIASISMIYGLLGKKSLLIYLGSMIGCAFLFGFMVDGLYAMMGMAPTAVTGQAAEIIPEVIEMVAAVILGLLLAYALAKPSLAKLKKSPGANCPTCIR
jgi:uncharacterized membrane protein YraQ (UPF0718 family)